MKVHRRRQSKFRDAKYALTTFMHGGALTCGHMEVFYHSYLLHIWITLFLVISDISDKSVSSGTISPLYIQ